MKSAALTVLLVILFFSCTKQAADPDDTVYISGNGLVGKWKAVEQYVSPGFGGSWNALGQDKRFLIEFKADSSFTYSANFPKGDSGYTLFSTNNTSINVRNGSGSKTDAWYYNPNPGDTLVLGVFQCYEGCAYRLRRVQ
jgi:hypothetical protein